MKISTTSSVCSLAACSRERFAMSCILYCLAICFYIWTYFYVDEIACSTTDLNLFLQLVYIVFVMQRLALGTSRFQALYCLLARKISKKSKLFLNRRYLKLP